MSDRCTGHCCRDFTLPFSPGELSGAVGDNIRAMNEELRGELLTQQCWERDLIQIHDMVVYLGNYGTDDFKERAWHYRCKNIQDNGDCGIYQTRPGMCRRFPSSGHCGYSACNWTEAREGRAPGYASLRVVG
jgi:Fe-S-cluster containining protein